MPRLLLVEADPFLQRTLQELFAGEGHSCAIAADGQATRRALQGDPFDLVVMDLGQLRADGLELLRELRVSHHTPLLLLAPHNGVIDLVAGLEVGADDYLCEPFDPRELMARVRAQLRRADEYSRPAAQGGRIELGTMTLDLEGRDASREGVSLNLTTREFQLLHLLAKHQNKALSSAWIFENIWGKAAEVGSKALTIYVGRLRSKIEVDARHPRLLLSIRGFGYKFVVESR